MSLENLDDDGSEINQSKEYRRKNRSGGGMVVLRHTGICGTIVKTCGKQKDWEAWTNGKNLDIIDSEITQEWEVSGGESLRNDI